MHLCKLKLTGKQVHINIIEIKQPDLDAHLVGEGIARHQEQRVAFRRAQKQQSNVQCVLEQKGPKLGYQVVSERCRYARAEGYSEKELFRFTHPRADIDYAFGRSILPYVNLVLKYDLPW